MEQVSALFDAVLNGDSRAAVEAAKAELAKGTSAISLVTDHMTPAMDEVGRLFEAQEYFVPELLVAGRAMKSVLEVIRPALVATGAQPVGRVVIGTVKGDLHDIGKNLVASMLEGGGFEVRDLGTDVAPERFVEAAKDGAADIVALSALLTVTVPAMRTTIDALRTAGVLARTRVIVGGAPVTAKYAEEVGADGYTDNASAAVRLARRLVEGKEDAIRQFVSL